MFIQTEQTPNPATLKFLPGRAVMTAGTANFADAEAAARSPLAQRLFAVDGVTGVFLGADFVSVSKDEAHRLVSASSPRCSASSWSISSPASRVLLGEAADGRGRGGRRRSSSQIKELLETRVRPAVAQDGGDIIFHRFEDGVVYLHMQGSCSGCPSSTATLKAGIENMLRHYVPEVVEVRAV